MTMRQRGGWRMGNDDEKVAMTEGVRVSALEASLLK